MRNVTLSVRLNGAEENSRHGGMEEGNLHSFCLEDVGNAGSSTNQIRLDFPFSSATRKHTAPHSVRNVTASTWQEWQGIACINIPYEIIILPRVI